MGKDVENGVIMVNYCFIDQLRCCNVEFGVWNGSKSEEKGGQDRHVEN